MPLAASRRKAVELVGEISLFHRTERGGAHASAEAEELLVGVGPAQKAWMSGTGKEQVEPEERWQRFSDQAREILAAMQRGRDRGGEERGATSGGGSSAETVKVLGLRGQDLPRLQNVMDPSAGCFKADAGSVTARGLWSVEGGERTYGDQRWLLRQREGPRFMRGAERVLGAAPVDSREKFSFSFVIRSR